VPSQVVTEGTRMLRFLTPTEPWIARVPSKVSLPGEWPMLLVEILHAEDGHLLLTCALGIPRNCVKAFLAQGAYPYDFDELPPAIVDVLDAHFAKVEEEIAIKIDSMGLPLEKPKLFLIKT